MAGVAQPAPRTRGGGAVPRCTGVVWPGGRCRGGAAVPGKMRACAVHAAVLQSHAGGGLGAQGARTHLPTVPFHDARVCARVPRHGSANSSAIVLGQTRRCSPWKHSSLARLEAGLQLARGEATLRPQQASKQPLCVAATKGRGAAVGTYRQWFRPWWSGAVAVHVGRPRGVAGGAGGVLARSRVGR